MGCIAELHPESFHPRQGSYSDPHEFLPHIIPLPLCFPFDPWDSTQPLTHINYTLLQLLLTQASGWHGIHTPPRSISSSPAPLLAVKMPLNVYNLCVSKSR